MTTCTFLVPHSRGWSKRMAWAWECKPSRAAERLLPKKTQQRTPTLPTECAPGSPHSTPDPQMYFHSPPLLPQNQLGCLRTQHGDFLEALDEATQTEAAPDSGFLILWNSLEALNALCRKWGLTVKPPNMEGQSRKSTPGEERVPGAQQQQLRFLPWSFPFPGLLQLPLNQNQQKSV